MKIACINMEDIIRDSFEAYRPVAEAKSINLTFEESEKGAFVRADREALLTVTNNLIGNAIRYTPSGGNVSVRCRPEADHWALVVVDDGVGIPIPEQDRIFERFYRLDRARESADGGSGIGLSIVKNLVLALHGHVVVSSSPNQGATFEVHLPLATAAQSTSAKGAADAAEDQVQIESEFEAGSNV